MAAPRFLALVAGGLRQVVAAAVGGAGSAEMVVSTNTSGVIDPSFFGPGIGPNIITVPASEALSAGAAVNLWVNGGATNARNSDASQADGGKPCDGFVLAAVSSGSTASVYRNGLNTSKTGLSPGLDYYLDPATPGGVTSTPPTTAGQTLQKVGKAITATSLDFQPQPFIGLH